MTRTDLLVTGSRTRQLQSNGIPVSYQSAHTPAAHVLLKASRAAQKHRPPGQVSGGQEAELGNMMPDRGRAPRIRELGVPSSSINRVTNTSVRPGH